MPYLCTCRCRVCGLEYEGVIQRKKDPNPRCPNLQCESRAGGTGRLFTTETRGAPVAAFAFDPAAGKAPAMGASKITKAIDATAQIVMEDHRMTDLQDNLRPGDSMAPKLRPDLQAKADAMFSPRRRAAGGRNPFSHAAMVARINSGALAPAQTHSPDIIGAVHKAKLAAPTIMMENKPPEPGRTRGGF